MANLDIILENVALVCLTLFATISFSSTGFGNAIIFNIGYWSFVSIGIIKQGSNSEVVIYMTFTFISVSIIQAIYRRNYFYFQPKFGVIYVVSTAITTIIGIQLLLANDNTTLTRVIGAIFFICFVINVTNDYLLPYIKAKKASLNTDQKNEGQKNEGQKNEDQNEDQNEDNNALDVGGIKTCQATKNNDIQSINIEIIDESNQHKTNMNVQKTKYGIPLNVETYELHSYQRIFMLILACLLSGMVRSLSGAGGPPMIVYALISNIDRRILVALTAWAAGFGSGIPMAVQLFIIHKRIDISRWYTYLLMVVAAIIGLMIGNITQKYVNQQQFRVALLFFLFAGSVNLMFVGMGNISKYISAGLLIILGLMVLMFVIMTIRKRTQQNN